MAKFFTLILHLSLAFALVVSSNADPLHSHRRDHLDLGRVIKKRAPQGLGVLGPAPKAATPSTAAQPTPTTSPSAETTPLNSVPVKSASSAASATSTAGSSTTSNGGGLLGGLVGGLLPTPTTSSSSTSTSSVRTSSTPAPQATAEPSPASQTPSILYITSTSAAPTPTQTSTTSGSTGMSSAAMTVLIVIAASIGAVIIVWTVIRKWKFRPSSDFEGRMQPIDWHPGAGEGASGIPGQHRPLSRASSFHSASSHDDQRRGQMAGHGPTSAPLNPIPDHDFTAGPAHFVPVGGYADLSRGLSPQPMMQEPLGRAPSLSRPAHYDQYGVPLHHGYGGY